MTSRLIETCRSVLLIVLFCAMAACSSDAPDSAREATDRQAVPEHPAADVVAELPKPEIPADEAPDSQTEAPAQPPPAPEPETPPAQTPASAEPQTHVVTALVTAFDPIVLFIQPGDTVRWTNMTGHDTQSIEGMIPTGAKSWRSQLGQEYAVTLTEPGAYVYKCNPHVGVVGYGSECRGRRGTAG